MFSVYYGVLTPIALLLRLRGHDPMRRRFDPDAKTYWQPHKPPTDRSRYFKRY